MKMVVVEVGEPAVIEDDKPIYRRGRELFNDSNFDKAHLGESLYLIVGDAAALAADRKANFIITNGIAKETVYGPAIFIQRISDADGLNYQPLTDEQAHVIVELMRQDRGRFDTRQLGSKLGFY